MYECFPPEQSDPDIATVINGLEHCREIDETSTVDDNAYERGRFDALDAISSVYYGKQYYFREDNGLIYSRDSCKYLTLEEAIYEFADKFGDDGEGY